MHAEPEARTVVSSRMLVRLIPALLAVVLGAWLLLPPTEDESPALAIDDGAGATDDAGLRTLAGATGAEPGLRGRTPTEGDDDPVPAAFKEGFERARERFRAMPFAVRFVEAETGRSVQVPWHPYDNRDIPLSADEEVPADAEEPEVVKAQAEPKGRPFARPSPQMLMPNRGCDGVYGVVLDGDALRRRVAWDEATWGVPISKYATSLEAVYPLRAEARVHVRGVEHDGAPILGIKIEGFKVAGRYSSGRVRFQPDGEGVLVRGLPFFRRQPLEVLVLRPPEREPDGGEEIEEECCIEFEEEDSVGGSLALDWYDRATVGKGRFHRRPERLVIIEARFAEDPDEGVVWSTGLWWEESVGTGVAPPFQGERGTLSVTVGRRDSGPAVGATVRCFNKSATTDERGVAVLRDVPVGERTVRLDEPGLVMTTQKVQVVAGVVTRVTLREAHGGSLRVRVLAPDGEPAPFAIIRLPSHAGWVDLDQGVQRLDPFTDVRGRRTLAHFPAGNWRVAASWGGLAKRVRVTVTEGGVATVTIKLPEPKTDDPK